MSLLASITTKPLRACAVCDKAVRTEYVDIGALYHVDCFIDADDFEPAETKPSPVVFRTRTPKRKPIKPPATLYCLWHCFRQMPVFFAEQRGYVCVGCRRVIWYPWGRKPQPNPDEGSCGVAFHFGDILEGKAVCFTCNGMWPKKRKKRKKEIVS